MLTSADAESAGSRLLELDLGFSPGEARALVKRLGREPSIAEATLFSIMWSEHCSYKSSRRALGRLPTRGEHVVLGPGEDAGVVTTAVFCAFILNSPCRNDYSAVVHLGMGTVFF